MKMNKRSFHIFIVAILIAAIFPVQVLAAGKIDLKRSVTLTISYQEEKEPLVGAVFEVFLVAEADQFGEVTVSEKFSEYHIDVQNMDDEGWRKLASVMAETEITPTGSGKTGNDGIVTFEKFPHGLYLVRGVSHTQNGNIYDTVPFFVMLPSLEKEDNEWRYDVVVKAKHESRPEEQPPENPQPENPPTKEPELPQTGQLWWPVPVLFAVGLLFVVVGLIRRRGAEYEE